jgi:hypothetical protein
MGDRSMNNLKQCIRIFFFIALLALAGCASRGDVVRHGFGFNFIADSSDAELLDYRYGQSRNPVRNPVAMVNRGESDQQNSVVGEMLRGDELYVKWRLKNTGQVFEDTVDLKGRLPADIENCKVYFLVRGPQLYVYLITPVRRNKDEPPNGPVNTQYRKTITLYPDSAR